MGDIAQFKSRKTMLTQSIEDIVTERMTDPGLVLPSKDDEIVSKYINLIEGEFDLGGVETDIKHSIELLNIAYNCAPAIASEGDIKIALDKIMTMMMHAQQTAINTMMECRIEISAVVKSIGREFIFWKPKSQKNDAKVVVEYVEKRFIGMLGKLKERSDSVCERLALVSTAFRNVVNSAQDAVLFLEKQIGIEGREREEIKSLLAETKALIDSLEESVKAIEDQIKKIDAQAEAFAKDARTAEERSFIAGLVGSIAGALAGVLPMAMAMANPAGAVSTAVASSIKDGKNQQLIESDQAQIDQNSQKIEAIDSEIETLEEQLELKKSKLASLTGKVPVAAGEDAPSDDAAEILRLKQGIKSQEGQIAKKKAARERYEKNSEKLEAALQGLRGDMNKMSDKQSSQAQSLRELQQECLNKADFYFKKKLDETKELGKLKGVIDSKKLTDNQLEVSIRSMNLSVQALKQCMVIIESISAFFNGFSLYLKKLSVDAEDHLDFSKEYVEDEDSQAEIFDTFCEMTNKFFIDQTAQWYAADMVCEKFGNCFRSGKAYASECYGIYLHGPKLNEFLAAAGDRIEAIIKERTSELNESLEKIVEIQKAA